MKYKIRFSQKVSRNIVVIKQINKQIYVCASVCVRDRAKQRDKDRETKREWERERERERVLHMWTENIHDLEPYCCIIIIKLIHIRILLIFTRSLSIESLSQT